MPGSTSLALSQISSALRCAPDSANRRHTCARCGVTRIPRSLSGLAEISMQLPIISRNEGLAQTGADWIGAPVKSSAQWACTFDYDCREERFLGSSAGHRATGLREAHCERVARNKVRVSSLWAQHCRAYNAHIELDARTRAPLEKTQQALKRVEPSLLACPREALHVSIAWLLAVHASYPVPKESLWERHGGEWIAELNRIAAESPAFLDQLRTRRGHRLSCDCSCRAERTGEPHPRAPDLALRDPQRG